MRIRAVKLLISLSALMFPSTFFIQAVNAQKQPESFVFLSMSGSRESVKLENDPLKSFVKVALDMEVRPAFAIATGDFTEYGDVEEYGRFKEGIAGALERKIDFHAIPGVREVHWSRDGKEGFSKAFGKLYSSFDYASNHFILLDSTVALHSLGHFDKSELDWLDKDLKRIKSDTPIFVFLNHLIGRESPENRAIDNEYDLLKRLQGKNVVAIFAGNDNRDLEWKTNGVETFMSKGLSQGSFYKISVTPLLATVDRVYTKSAGPEFHVAIPITRRSKPSLLRAGWDDPDNPFLERKRPAVTLEPRAVSDNPDKEKSEYRIDEGAWKPMAKDARDIWRDTFQTKGIAVGVHTASVRLTTSANVPLNDELIFEIERESSEPTRRWAINLDGPIQSSPLVFGETVYSSALDGKLYALSTDKGKKRWTFPTKAPIYGSPIVEDNTIFIASSDHFLYAVDAANGKMKWKHDSGGVLLSTPAVANGVVCIGGDSKIIGLDAGTGLPKWETPTKGFFQSKAATDGGSFYLAGSDSRLYALDALTGKVRWSKSPGKSASASPLVASPCVSDGRVYVCTKENALYSLNALNGDIIWAVKSPREGDAFGDSSPVVMNKRLYIAGNGENGDVYCLNLKDGSVVWQTPTGQQFYDSSVRIAPDGSSLAIMGVRGKCSVLSCESGKKLWGYELGPGNVFSTPDYDGKSLYTVTMANDVQAINAPNSVVEPKGKSKLK